MLIHHHPDDSTILAQAAGSLGEGLSLVVAAHLERCPHCRNRMSEAEAFGGELLSELEPTAMTSNGFESLWERVGKRPEADPRPRVTSVSSSNAAIPRVLQPYLDGDLDSLRWRRLVPGIRQYPIKDLRSGRGSVRLISIAPGVTIPHHTHGGTELTLVLRGSYIDEIGRFQAGDLADLDTSVHHQPVSDTAEPCICLIATDERLRFSGMFSRMLQPMVGI
jgi:putative transcriptional regulator